jgi:hypothetical protein
VIPEPLALFNSILYFTAAALLGGVSGLVAAFGLRLPLGGKVFLQDAGVAALATIVTAAALFLYDWSHGGLQDRVGSLFVAAIVAPAAHQLARSAWRRRR